MRGGRLQQLLRRIEVDGIDSPHLDRLRLRIRALTASHRTVEQEILAEMASALGQSEEKVLVALAELAVARHDLDRAPPVQRDAAVARYNTAREAALSARRDLAIHREAIGLRGNELLDELYPIGERVRPGP